MDYKYSVKLSKVIKELELEPVHRSRDYDGDVITSPDVNRCGLQLAGFYDYFHPERPMVIGRTENAYLSQMSAEDRAKSLDRLLRDRPTMLTICHEVEPMPECIAAAERYDVNIFRTDTDTSEFVAGLIGLLSRFLAPRTTIHGGLVEVHGEGLLITGDSGIGKSETELELVKRGHKLIADDAVEIRRTSRTTLVGTSPSIIRYYMEVRGIGIIDARNIFGVGAVKPSTKIDLLVNLKLWREQNDYDRDRMGLEDEYSDILGVKVPMTTIPVTPGRSLATILEVAAINHRQKKMGYNAARTLLEQHDSGAREDGDDALPPNMIGF